MRTRDYIVLTCLLIGILFSFDITPHFELKESFKLSISTSYYENGHYPSEKEQLPSPLITDLEGDGINEIITLNTDNTIEIGRMHRRRRFSTISSNKQREEDQSQFYQTDHKASLLSSVHRVRTGRRPVALASGYLTPLDENDRRQQVIVVMLESWSVICFDAQLRLLWETSVDSDHYEAAEFFHREAAIQVLPIPLHQGDRGCVIVSGRMISTSVAQERNEAAAIHHHEMEDQDERYFSGRSRRVQSRHHAGDQGDQSPKSEPSDDEFEEHYSFYALEGATGIRRWKHDSHDFFAGDSHESEHMREKLLPFHNHAMHVLAHTHNKHLGEVDWSEFDRDMMQQLPHHWSSRFSTFLELDHFERERRQGRGGSTRLPRSRGQVHHLVGVAGGGFRPHKESDHVKQPNVVVAHTEDGIEVIHLYTGRTLCRLALTPHQYSVYADVNGDSIPDRVHVVSTTAHHHNEAFKDRVSTSNRDKISGDHQLMLVAETVVPPHFQLWNTSLIVKQSFISKLSEIAEKLSTNTEYALDMGWGQTQKMASTSNPVVVRSSDEEALYFVYILLADGNVVCFHPLNGKIRWRTRSSTTATSGIRMVSKAQQHRVHTDQQQGDHQAHATPQHLSAFSLHAFSSQVYSNHPQDWLLALASHQMSLIHAETGQLIAETNPSAVPIGLPIFADFNNDGFTDIIITTASAYYGFAITYSGGTSTLIPTLLIVLILAIATIIVTRMLNKNFQNRNSKKPIVMSIKRATD